MSSPVFSKDHREFYIGSGDGSVYAIDSYHGHMIWNVSTEGAILASPALSNEGDVISFCITNLPLIYIYDFTRCINADRITGIEASLVGHSRLS